MFFFFYATQHGKIQKTKFAQNKQSEINFEFVSRKK